MEWCFAAASVTGVSHIRAGTRRQDAKHCFSLKDGRSVGRLFAAVADGAGSADFGGEGASVICRSIGTQAREFFRRCNSLPDDEVIWSWIDLARDRLQLAARNRGRTPRDFASTLVLVLADPQEVVTAHVGDGAAVGRFNDSERWAVLSPPHHGRYASTTYFLTDDPQPALRIARQSNKFDALAVFSDGIENLVLDSVTGEPSGAFFTPMARPLAASKVAGEDLLLSKQLAAFLAGERFNESTDDDKTLIVAVVK